MSHAAIAAALAAEDLSVSQRLVAFSMASFANSDQLAWAGLRSRRPARVWVGARISLPAITWSIAG